MAQTHYSPLHPLLEIESIQQLKYRYFRYLDQRQLDALEQLLVPDCTSAYHNGAYSHDNRDGIMAFLRGSIGSGNLLTLHQGHHPEIELLSDTEAQGFWYLQDIVIDKVKQTRLEGNGFYEDRYRKVNGEWKISHIGYKRTFDIRQPLGELLEFYDGFAEGAFDLDQTQR